MVPQIKGDYNVTQSGSFVKVISKCGVKVEFDGDREARVLAPRSQYESAMYGLCGDCNGKRHNDVLVQGKALKSFGNRKRGLRAFALQFLVQTDSNEAE